MKVYIHISMISCVPKYMLRWCWLTTMVMSFSVFPRRLVLVGMPSVGKSTLARFYANFTRTPLFDTDSFLSIPSCPPDDVETWRTFRKEEHAVLKRILEDHFAFVVATGGGIADYPPNKDFLMNMKDEIGLSIIHIRTKNMTGSIIHSHHKPLPDKYGVLYRQRIPIYETVSEDEYWNDYESPPERFVSWMIQRIPPL